MLSESEVCAVDLPAVACQVAFGSAEVGDVIFEMPVAVAVVVVVTMPGIRTVIRRAGVRGSCDRQTGEK